MNDIINIYQICENPLFYSFPNLDQCSLRTGISIKSIEWLPNDITARTHPRKNNDGVECALIRIVIPMVKNIQFSNTYMIGHQDYIPGEYQVGVFPGVKKFTIHHENYPLGDIVLADYLKDEDSP